MMKKLMFGLLCGYAITSFAMEKDCTDFNNPTKDAKVVQRVQDKGIKSLNISYSADLATPVNELKNQLQAAGVTVASNQVAGTGICEMSGFKK